MFMTRPQLGAKPQSPRSPMPGTSRGTLAKLRAAQTARLAMSADCDAYAVGAYTSGPAATDAAEVSASQEGKAALLDRPPADGAPLPSCLSDQPDIRPAKPRIDIAALDPS